MVDLRDRPELLQDLYDHVAHYEGLIRYFYCDNRRGRGLVTIAIGELVDHVGYNKSRGRVNAADWLQRKSFLVFKHKNTDATANPQQILDDWERVFEKGREFAGQNKKAREYRSTARYRISREDAFRLKRVKMNIFLDELYDKKAFVHQLDVYIHMAIVDSRFNPSHVGVYDMEDDPDDHFHRLIPVMWDYMNPTSPDYDLERALRVFTRIWRNKGAPDSRYRERVRKRVYWFGLGVQRTLTRPDPVSPNPASPTASVHGRNMQFFKRRPPVRGGQRRRGPIGHA